MEIFRTPDDRFADLPGYAFAPSYLVGFGRSDKPAAREAAVVDRLALRDVTLFCQDWGGRIGLRLVAEDAGRFARVVASNTFVRGLMRGLMMLLGVALAGCWTGSPPPATVAPVGNEAPPRPVTHTPAPLCDEVACVLDPDQPCCARFGHKAPPPSNGADALDRTMITDGIARVKPQIIACGSQTGASGIVKVSVVVGPNGAVVRVTLKESPDPALGTCVVEAIKRARFAATTNGGSFSYPFVF